MIDLTSREMQSTFKKLERTTLVTNITMCIVTLLAAAIAVWGSASAKGEASWSEIMFYVLIALLAAYFAAVLVWEIVLRRKNSKAMHAFVAEVFSDSIDVLEGDGAPTKGAENISFETSLAGDKLVVMRTDSGRFVEFDLAPVRNYSSVCAYTVRLAKRYVRDYYSLKAQEGGIDGVILTDNVQGRGRKQIFIEGGKPKFALLLKFSYFIRHGLINLHPEPSAEKQLTFLP
ncbi:MAG: hypothetical protein NC033_01575 [Clostridiales bacterium]|nr:hypothetical protein [Clostridiales bacterium]